ncbi:hypothetical protein VCHENC02_5110A, partial [Vibrio harveyi]
MSFPSSNTNLTDCPLKERL